MTKFLNSGPGHWLLWGLLVSVTALATAPAKAGPVRIAVASNFTQPVKALAEAYRDQTGNTLVLAFGSTGKHYAQIRHGAPFDAFLAADSKRPRLLEEAGIGIAGSRFTYALGRLVLWSPRPAYVDPKAEVLARGDFRYLAIANPDLAPYGRAARETLAALALWEPLQGRLVRGENIAQAFQFVVSGNAELGFVAASQLKGRAEPGSAWPVPEHLYAPIRQQALLLRENPVARAFLAFLSSSRGRAIIRQWNYRVPDDQ